MLVSCCQEKEFANDALSIGTITNLLWTSERGDITSPSSSAGLVVMGTLSILGGQSSYLQAVRS